MRPAGAKPAIPLLVALAGCVSGPEIGRTEAAATVAEVADGGCSTAVVIGLSTQIADEVGCMAADALVPFEEGTGIHFAGAAVLPYLAPDARDDLLAAAGAGGTMEITSAYRTVVQQLLLYRWYQQGLCGITAAATPGNSNHESGRAVDLGNWSAWVGAMGDHGWAHDVAGDDVHFDHLDSPDLSGMDVQAFQRLWNRNTPDDPIDEDGAYGPQTEDRLLAAPADGFAVGTCADGGGDPDPPSGGGPGSVDGDVGGGGGCAAGSGAGGWLAGLVLAAAIRMSRGARRRR
ncbi:MAG TPA: M15 family metallopeptidase [Kofleriaceae bacterium]|nr:M15 family metallopeptidase [Kofleriaceae bacterium]